MTRCQMLTISVLETPAPIAPAESPEMAVVIDVLSDFPIATAISSGCRAVILQAAGMSFA